MKGYRFYLEYPDKKSKRSATRKELGNHSGVVIALMLEAGTYFNIENQECSESIRAIRKYPNSVVSLSGVNLTYINKSCKWISEEQARKIHPKLFKRLDKK